MCRLREHKFDARWKRAGTGDELRLWFADELRRGKPSFGRGNSRELHFFVRLTSSFQSTE